MKTHEEMTRDVFQRIHAYEEEKQAKRARMMRTAVPVCALAVIGVGLWNLGIFRSDDGLLVNRSADSGAAPAVTELSAETEPTVLQTTAEQTEPGTASAQTSEAEGRCTYSLELVSTSTSFGQAWQQDPATTAVTTTTVSAQNSSALASTTTSLPVMKFSVPKSTTTTTGLAYSSITTTTTTAQQIHLPNSVFPPDSGDPNETWEPDYTLIYQYGGPRRRIYEMPKSGEVICSVQLKDAMEHYGADAPYHYLTAVRMFDSDGALMEDRASLEAEAARLAELGYVGTAVEQVIDYPPYLVLNVTYEQIAAFQGKEGYGYFLHLRDEGSWSIAVS